MSIHSEQAFITWLIGVLQAGGLTVGDAVAPPSVPAGAGYVVVYSITGGVTTGSLEDPRSDAEVTVQVTSSGATPTQTRWLVDKVRTLLNAAVPAVLVGGRKVIWLDFPAGAPNVVREDNVQPSRWSAPDRFEMGTA